MLFLRLAVGILIHTRIKHFFTIACHVQFCIISNESKCLEKVMVEVVPSSVRICCGNELLRTDEVLCSDVEFKQSSWMQPSPWSHTH